MIGKSLKTNDFLVGNDQVVCLVSCAHNRLVVASQVCYHELARPLAGFPPCCSSTSGHWYLAPPSNPGGSSGVRIFCFTPSGCVCCRPPFPIVMSGCCRGK